MKKSYGILMFLLLLVSSSEAFAQLKGQELLDSLVSELNAPVRREVNDSNKAKLLLAISDANYDMKVYDGSIKYATQAEKLATKLSMDKTIAQANFRLAKSYYAKSDYPKSIECAFKSLKTYELLQDTISVAANMHVIGNVYYSSNNTPDAIEYYTKELKIFEQLKDSARMVPVLGNLGNCYQSSLKFDLALEYQMKTLKLAETLQLERYIINTLANIGWIYQSRDNYDYPMALLYYFKALKTVTDTSIRSTILGNIGTVYVMAGIKDSLGLIKPSALMPGSKSERLKLAVKYLTEAIEVLRYLGDMEGQAYYYGMLTQTNVEMGDYKAAYNNYLTYRILKDSVFSVENDKAMMKQQMQYDYDKKAAIANAEQEKKVIIQKNIRNTTLGGMAALLLFTGVVMRQRNKVRKQKSIVEKEKARSEELLLNILPEEVAEELKEKGGAEAKLIEQTTVLFTDFKGFTQLSEKMSPQDLVAQINNCFSAFDLIMQKHGVEKIKTIGDAYMAAGGLPTPNTTNATDVVKAAIDVQQFMMQYKKEKEAAGQLYFEIRIGIHTGPVVAGIVGVKKFAYDIWGDTVNTASRMESSGEPGKINISQTTYELVKDKFTCIYRGELEAKNKGMLKMYFVEA